MQSCPAAVVGLHCAQVRQGEITVKQRPADLSVRPARHVLEAGGELVLAISGLKRGGEFEVWGHTHGRANELRVLRQETARGVCMAAVW